MARPERANQSPDRKKAWLESESMGMWTTSATESSTMDQEKDIELGQQALRQMSSRRHYACEVRDTSLQQYVQNLGAKMRAIPI
jgi:predicted Zn-dependent protease